MTIKLNRTYNFISVKNWNFKNVLGNFWNEFGTLVIVKDVCVASFIVCTKNKIRYKAFRYKVGEKKWCISLPSPDVISVLVLSFQHVNI